MNTFNTQHYKDSLHTFPDISYEEFQHITDIDVRRDIVKKNRILMTDTYNRTMEHTRGSEKNHETETYTLSFRKSPNKTYNVVYGVRNMIKDLFSYPITQAEFAFARDFYAAQKNTKGVSYFDTSIREDIIQNHGGMIPLTIKAVADGTVVKVNEPVLSVTGEWYGELAARFEPIFLRLFYTSAVATGAQMIEDILKSKRVVEFGMRSAINHDAHFDAIESCIVWMGLEWTSNDMAAAVYPQTYSAGTTAHRFYASYPTEDEAFELNIQKNEKVALLIDLADSYSGIRKAVALKKKYRHTNKPIAMRLDSGDLADQAIYALKLLHGEWMQDPLMDKIIIADIGSIEKLVEVENKIRDAGFDPEKYIAYGLGGLLVAKEKTRDALSAGYKLTQTGWGPTGKLSNDPGKEPIPGILNIELRDGQRFVVQDTEEIQGERLLTTAYDKGNLYLITDNDVEAITNARNQLQKTLEYVQWPTTESDLTKNIHTKVREQIRANIR